MLELNKIYLRECLDGMRQIRICMTNIIISTFLKYKGIKNVLK